MQNIYQRSVEAELSKIQESELSKTNKARLQGFVRHRDAQNISTGRIVREVQILRRLAQQLEQDLVDVTDDGIRDLVRSINHGDVVDAADPSPWTLKEYRQSVKRFYELQDRDVAWIRCNPPENQRPVINPADLPREQEIHRMIDACESLRSKARIFLIWDTGARISEALNVQWKHVSFGPRLTRIHLPVSKTRPRTVPVKDCTDVLRRRKEQMNAVPDDYVTGSDDGSSISYRTALKNLKAVSEYSPHDLRRGRATDLVRKGFSSYQLMAYMGWSKLETAMRYVRLADSDLEDAVLALPDPQPV